MLPDCWPLPHLICSRHLWVRSKSDEADQCDDERGINCCFGKTLCSRKAGGKIADPRSVRFDLWDASQTCDAFAAGADKQRQSRTRAQIYDEAARQALIVLWEASDRICVKRLKPLLPILISSMEQHGHFKLDDQVRTLLLQMSAATIDRALKSVRETAGGRRRRRSVASSALKRSVPIRKFSDWDDPAPGFIGADRLALRSQRTWQLYSNPCPYRYCDRLDRMCASACSRTEAFDGSFDRASPINAVPAPWL